MWEANQTHWPFGVGLYFAVKGLKFLSLFRWERGEISRKFRENFEILLIFLNFAEIPLLYVHCLVLQSNSTGVFFHGPSGSYVVANANVPEVHIERLFHGLSGSYLPMQKSHAKVFEEHIEHFFHGLSGSYLPMQKSHAKASEEHIEHPFHGPSGRYSPMQKSHAKVSEEHIKHPFHGPSGSFLPMQKSLKSTSSTPSTGYVGATCLFNINSPHFYIPSVECSARV